MAKRPVGYGLKVKTDEGHLVWLTKTGTTTYVPSAMSFDSQEGATQYAQLLSKANNNITIFVVKFGVRK